MRIGRSIAAAALAALFPMLLLAANLTGTWRGKMDAGGEAILHLTGNEKTISGTMVGADGKDYPITEGKVEGDNISFAVASQWQGMPVTLLVSGKLSGDQMQLHIAADNGYWQTDATVQKEAK